MLLTRSSTRILKHKKFAFYRTISCLCYDLCIWVLSCGRGSFSDPLVEEEGGWTSNGSLLQVMVELSIFRKKTKYVATEKLLNVPGLLEIISYNT